MKTLMIITIALAAACSPADEPILQDSSNDPNNKSDEPNNTTPNNTTPNNTTPNNTTPNNLPSDGSHPMSQDVVEGLDGDPARDVCEDEGRYGDGACDRRCDRQDSDCPPREWLRDTLAVDLSADVQTGDATALITLAAETYRGVSLRVNELDIAEITDGDGNPLDFTIADYGVSSEFDQDDLGDILFVPDATDVLHVTYTARTDPYADWAFGDTTLAWPTNCARLFPCNPRPDDGITFSLDVQNVPDGEVAIFPEAVNSPGPSYMLAWAIGAYEHAEIGTTAAGTTVHVWWLPGSETAALAGTQDLHLAFQWLEQNLGAYEFGSDVGAIEAQWGPGGLGGMEHHPLWHVARDSMGDRTVHVHEAVHGWFGDGIRIACWEDFVLSEGVTTYLTARVIEQVYGAVEAQAVWDDYALYQSSWGSSEAWRPETCELESVNRTEIWSLAPYRRGAFFLRQVASEIGPTALDSVLASFYQANKLEARRFVDLLDHIESETGFEAHDLALDWLTGALPPIN